MQAYIIRRLILSVVVLFAVPLIVFTMMFILGDPAEVVATPDWTKEDLARFRHAYGLDRPFYVQYASFFSGLLRLDFGESILQREKVFTLLKERIVATAELSGTAILMAWILGVPLGMLAALSRGALQDRLIMLLTVLGQSVPVFWLGIILILIFAVFLGWLPAYGRGGLDHLILPSITLSLFFLALNARITRSSMLEVAHEDYVRTAHAKGLTYKVVVVRHMLRNALIPLVTLMAIDVRALFGGSVITETIYAWPGIGRLMIQALLTRDFPVVVGAVTILAVVVVTINLMVDLLYGVLDPRIRFT